MEHLQPQIQPDPALLLARSRLCPLIPTMVETLDPRLFCSALPRMTGRASRSRRCWRR
jgi:hypothetical protein